MPEPTAKGYRHIAEAPEAQRLLNAIIEEIRASGESSTGFPGDVLIRPTDAEELLEAARSRRGARPSLKLLPVSEDLALDVSDVRMLEIRAVYGNLTLVGSRCDAIEIVGPVNGSAVVAVGDGLGRIVVGRGDRSASFGRGKILGELMVKGPPSVDVVVQSDSSVDSLHIHGVIRSLECRGDVAETITICDIGGVTDDVHLHGSARRLWLLGGGRIDGELIVDGRLDSFEASGGGRGGGHLGRSVVLNPSSRTSVDSLSELVDDRIALNSNVDLSGCSIGQIPDLQKVRFVGGSHFAREHGRIIIQDEVRARRREDADFASVAHTYRALRSASVEVYDRVFASDLYYREMRARQRSSRGAERLLIASYRGLSAYGTRAWIPALWLLAGIAASSLAFGLDDVLASTRTFSERLLIAFQTALSFLGSERVAEGCRNGSRISSDSPPHIRYCMPVAGSTGAERPNRTLGQHLYAYASEWHYVTRLAKSLCAAESSG